MFLIFTFSKSKSKYYNLQTDFQQFTCLICDNIIVSTTAKYFQNLDYWNFKFYNKKRLFILIFNKNKQVKMHKKSNYQQYRALSKKQKQKRIQDAEQNPKDYGPNPQGNCNFQQLNWVTFQVLEKNKKIKLTTYRHLCLGQCKAIVIMLHGLNSYIGHGAHIAHHYAKHGLTTVGFDHRGFGRSQGEPGYAESLENHIQDTLKFIEIVRFNYPKLPFFCLGLSMGGMTTYYLTLKYKYLFEGAIMMAPAIKNNLGGFLVSMVKAIGSILPGGTKLMKPIYGKASRNPKITQDVKNDQFAFSEKARLSTLTMLVKTMDKTPQTFPQYKSPFMIVQGGLDKLVNPQGAFQLYDNSATSEQDKQLLFYEKMWHDIWHEPEIPEIIQKTTQWMLKRLKKIQKKENSQSQPHIVKIKRQITGQKISLKPDQPQLSNQIHCTASQQIRLQQKMQQFQQHQIQKQKQEKQKQIQAKKQEKYNV